MIIAIINGGIYYNTFKNVCDTYKHELIKWENFPCVQYDLVIYILDEVYSSADKEEILWRKRLYIEYLTKYPPTVGWCMMVSDEYPEIVKISSNLLGIKFFRSNWDTCYWDTFFKKRFRIWTSKKIKTRSCRHIILNKKDKEFHDINNILTNKELSTEYLELVNKHNKENIIPFRMIKCLIIDICQV